MKWILSAGAALFFGALVASAVNADTTNTNSNTQTASNVASSTQTSAAVSGAATASGAGATATSGNAASKNVSVIKQKISQKAANQVAAVPCDCDVQLPWSGTLVGNTTNTNTNSQAGGQEAGQAQDSAAATLDADASGALSVATTGFADSRNISIIKQRIKQAGINQGLLVTPAEEP